MVDETGDIAWLNTGAEDMLGLSRRQATGRALTVLIPQLRELLPLIGRAAVLGQSFGQLITFTPPGRADSSVEVTCRVSPVSAATGARLIVELFDATQWRQIDREHALIAQREASRRMIRQLAHEIRNPLGGLRGAAQLLERELPTPELREYTRIIIGEADRLTALTEGLLGPTRRLQRVDVNVHEILERVLLLVASEHGDAVRIGRDYDPSLPALWADADALLQAFLNLARNALQAVGQQGYVLFRTRALTNFQIGAVRHKVVVSVDVEDDGPGVPAEIADTLFYPLVTGREGGTGLGLPLSQDLVRRHGGLIEYQSRPRRTVFSVRIPAGHPTEDET